MDMKETSAMTEASGIANDETDRALGTRPAPENLRRCSILGKRQSGCRNDCAN